MSVFNQELWDRAEVVIKHSNDRRKELEEFVTILSKRVDIEETYAKSLEENAKMAEKIKQGEDNIPQYAFTSFKENCANRSSQTRTFAKSLKEQILMPLKSLVANQQQESKAYQKDWKRMDKEIQELQHNIIKCRNRYDDQYNDYEEMLMINEITLESHKVAKDKRSKVISKTNQLMKGLNELERNYERAISDYNTFLAQFYLELVKIMDVFQKQEELRLATQQENILKMLVFETSMLRNFQYDINTITKQVQKAKKVDCVRQFVDKHKTGRQREKGMSKHLRKNMLGESIYRIISKDIEKRIALEKNVEFKKYVDGKFKKIEVDQEFTLFKPERLVEFEKVFLALDLCWNGTPLTPEQKDQLILLLKSDVNRLAFSMYLHQFQTTNRKVVCQSGYDEIVKLLLIILEICEEFQDVFVTRKLTNAAFSLYKEVKQDKVYLHQGLIECKIYALIDYWKAAIFETAQEELILHFEQNINEESEMKYMSLVLGQLAMFCHQMVLLGVPSKEVRQSIGWYCRLYEISDDQNRDLARTVNASMKIYKQLYKTPEVVAPVQEVVRKISFQIAGESVKPTEQKVEEKQEKPREEKKQTTQNQEKVEEKQPEPETQPDVISTEPKDSPQEPPQSIPEPPNTTLEQNPPTPPIPEASQQPSSSDPNA